MWAADPHRARDKMPKNLEEIWYDLRPGNIVAYQTLDGWDGSRYTEVDKIRIGTVVAIDIFDMALAVGVVDLCKFDCFGIRHTKEKLPEIEWLIEWGTTNYVVGFWTHVPSVSEVKRAIRDFRMTALEPGTPNDAVVPQDGSGART